MIVFKYLKKDNRSKGEIQMRPTYSIAIRTLGTAGEKYRKLLESIDRQTYRPEKVVVVLPNGYTPPQDILGYEEFHFSAKGMVIQRLAALKYINSKYILFCDDDVSFNNNFCEALINTLEKSEYTCAAGPLLSFFPPDGVKYIFASLLGGACKMLYGTNYQYTRILSTGGWSYNKNINTSSRNIYKADSLAWTCFMINSNVLRSIHMEDESWIDANGYAAYDDQTMFYKLVVNGYQTAVVSDAIYEHNDGKTSTKNLKLEPIYAHSRNHYIFWHRFLYLPSKNTIDRLWKKICIHYYMAMSRLYGWGLYLTGRQTMEERKASVRGFRDARMFVKSQEYWKLPGIKIHSLKQG